VKQWRVTKYNPAYRDTAGAYERADWTSIDDVGKIFQGTVLTQEEYARVEGLYVASAAQCVREAGIPGVTASSVEPRRSKLVISDGMFVDTALLPAVLRELLRCTMWCKLEHDHEFYIHVGYDYYMYIGYVDDLPTSLESAARSGLFVEGCPSPYLEWGSVNAADVLRHP
jgi:hypothetical protein